MGTPADPLAVGTRLTLIDHVNRVFERRFKARWFDLPALGRRVFGNLWQGEGAFEGTVDLRGISHRFWMPARVFEPVITVLARGVDGNQMRTPVRSAEEVVAFLETVRVSAASRRA